MGIGIGPVEIAFVALFWIVAALVTFGRFAVSRLCVALAICTTVSAVVTPADPMSCVVLGLMLFAAYFAGAHFGGVRVLKEE
jgi:Sec-independent protein secretion pathway component TatC